MSSLACFWDINGNLYDYWDVEGAVDVVGT